MAVIDEDPKPMGALTLQTITLPADTNPNGNIFGGWLMSQMDLAGSILAIEYAQSSITTVAVGGMSFLRPIPVGATVSCYTQAIETGRSSIRTMVEVWVKHYSIANNEPQKVTEAEFVYVAIDESGRTKPLKKRLQD